MFAMCPCSESSMAGRTARGRGARLQPRSASATSAHHRLASHCGGFRFQPRPYPDCRGLRSPGSSSACSSHCSPHGPGAGGCAAVAPLEGGRRPDGSPRPSGGGLGAGTGFRSGKRGPRRLGWPPGSQRSPGPRGSGRSAGRSMMPGSGSAGGSFRWRR